MAIEKFASIPFSQIADIGIQMVGHQRIGWVNMAAYGIIQYLHGTTQQWTDHDTMARRN